MYGSKDAIEDVLASTMSITDVCVGIYPSFLFSWSIGLSYPFRVYCPMTSGYMGETRVVSPLVTLPPLTVEVIHKEFVSTLGPDATCIWNTITILP